MFDADCVNFHVILFPVIFLIYNFTSIRVGPTVRLSHMTDDVSSTIFCFINHMINPVISYVLNSIVGSALIKVKFEDICH